MKKRQWDENEATMRLQHEILGNGTPPHEMWDDVLAALDIEDRAAQIVAESAARQHGENGVFAVEDAMIAALDAGRDEDDEYGDFEPSQDSYVACESAKKERQTVPRRDLEGSGVGVVTERDEMRAELFRGTKSRLGAYPRNMEARRDKSFFGAEATSPRGSHNVGRKPRDVNRPRPERAARKARKHGFFAARIEAEIGAYVDGMESIGMGHLVNDIRITLLVRD